jgi:hypothetical protein
MSKYESLRHFLQNSPLSSRPMTFAEIEEVIGSSLPNSAYTHRAWWSNNPSNNVMTKEWLAAGFETEQVDLDGKHLVFRRKARADAGGTTPEAPSSDALRYPVHPLYGAFKGYFTVAEGVDLTEPADPDWGKVYEER